MFKKRWVVMAAALLAIGDASAGIVIGITNHQGFAQFDLSGSDQLTSSGFMGNGFWLSASALPNLWTTSGGGVFNFTSGSGSFTFGDVTTSIYDIVKGSNSGASYALGLRGGNPVSQTSGTAVSVTGSLLSNIAFTAFNGGTYQVGSLGPQVSSSASLRDGVTVNVLEVPEPATLALVGIGLLAGLSTSRRRQRSAATTVVSSREAARFVRFFLRQCITVSH